MEEKLNLLAKLAAKKVEIQALVAKKQGMVAFSDFTPLSYKRLEVLADQNLEDWLAADRTGDPATQDDPAFSQLAREYYQIKKRLEEL